MQRLYHSLFLSRPLTYKIAVATITPVLICWVLSIVLGLESLERSIEKDYHNQNYKIVAKVADSLADPEHFYSKDFLIGNIKLLSEISRVMYSMVLDENNQHILIHSDPKLSDTSFDPEIIQDEDILNVSSPVIIDDVLVGRVIVGISTENIDSSFQQHKLVLLGIAVIVFATGVLLAFLLAKIFSRPVREMAIQSKRIGAGNFDQQIDYSGKDALGELTSSFNNMSRDLDKTLSALYEERAGLRSTVEAKTAELRKSMDTLHSTNLHLEEALRTRSRFFTTMNHELRTPLNGILGISNLLQEQHFGQLNEKQQEYVKQIDESGKHLLSLVNDLLDIAKIDAGSMKINKNPFDLVECMKSTHTMMDSLLERKKLHLHTELPDALLVHGDYRRIRQILFNLLSNAIKFTPQEGKITVSATSNSEMVEIKVADTGIGISEEEQARIFSEFYQTEQKNTEQKEGTGLGLALCKRLVKLHEGTIGVESNIGTGSTFWFTLPIEK